MAKLKSGRTNDLINIQQNKKGRQYTSKRLRTWKLQDLGVRTQYRILVKEKVPEGDLRDVEEEWKDFKNTLIHSTEEVCGRAGGRKKEKQTPWWNESVKEAVKRKQKAWQKMEADRTQENIEEYRRVKSNLKTMVKEEKIKSMKKFAERLQDDFKGNKKMLYGMIKESEENQETNNR